LSGKSRYATFKAMQEVRRRRGFPRWIVLMEDDNTLPVDLDNPLSVDAFVQVLRRSETRLISEMYPAPDDLCVTGPEGRFCHELVVPFVRRTDVIPTQGDRVAGRPRALPTGELSWDSRLLPPGSDWLYVKLYGGLVQLEDLLLTTLPDLIEALFEMRLVRRWFFVRYADPDHHLRVRLEASSAENIPELWRIVTEAIKPHAIAGRLWKVQCDTYQREIERYGGLAGTQAAEDVFFADSEAVLKILRALDPDDPAEIRWRIGCAGVDTLLGDCGLAIEQRKSVILGLRNFFRVELSTHLRAHELAERFRSERSHIHTLLASSPTDATLFSAKAALTSRSEEIRKVIERLKDLQQTKQVWSTVGDLAASYSHMHLNRLIGLAGIDEYLVYDFLDRFYDSILAQNRARAM
jgi:thiopeptide-type bacteriocin biosynthesis protein